MIALFDADILLFRCCAAQEAEPKLADYDSQGKWEEACEEVKNRTAEDVCKSFDKFVFNLCIKAGLDLKDAIFYLSHDTSYRKELAPSYKAQRPIEKPRYFEEVREYLKSNYQLGAAYLGWEADDSLGYSQTLGTMDTVIISVDKDLLQIPGKHYNFVKDEWKTVSEWDGLKWFYSQMLIGDSADNVKGVAQIGPVKAEKLLGQCTTEEEMFNIVKEKYNDDNRFKINSQLLWIQRADRKNPVQEAFEASQD